MTYCVGLVLDRGLLFMSDTRTNAGVDNFSMTRKMFTFEAPGERLITIMTAGNLATTQSVISLLEERSKAPEDRNPSILKAPSMFQVARLVGATLREVIEEGGTTGPMADSGFSATLIVGGQITGSDPRLFLIYPEGNFIEAGEETPFFQIGETKYGKPILVRTYDPKMNFNVAAKLLLVSFDSTVKSNLSVGLPFDLQIYERDTLRRGKEVRIEQDDPVYQSISNGWGDALRASFDTLPTYDILVDQTELAPPAGRSRQTGPSGDPVLCRAGSARIVLGRPMSNLHSTVTLAKSKPEAQLDPSAPIPRAPGTEQGHVIALVLTFMMVVLTFVVLDFAKIFFAPVLSGFVLGIVLSPLSRLWAKIGFGPAVSAFLSLLVVIVGLIGIAFLVEPYVTMVIQRAPLIWNEVRESVEGLRQMLRGLDEISDRIASAMSPDASLTAATAAPAIEAEKEAVTVPTITDALFYAPTFLTQFMIFAGTLFFFLFTRHEIYRWVGNTLRSVDAEDFERGERRVAKYFLTITTINVSFGVIVFGVMQLLGMPGPVFWGLCACLLNFVLYLGPITLAATLLVTGIVVFDGVMSVVPAGIYMSMNMIEGQFVTPYFVGQQMRVNPLLVFLSLVFWLWLWGPIGGIIAIPLMIWSIAMAEAILGHTISSGIPGKFRPNLRAGADVQGSRKPRRSSGLRRTFSRAQAFQASKNVSA